MRGMPPEATWCLRRHKGKTVEDNSGNLIRRTEVEVRGGKVKNGTPEGKDEVTRETINGRGDWIWRLCCMAFENGAVPED